MKPFSLKGGLLALSLGLSLSSHSFGQAFLYVDATSPAPVGNQDGMSWATAYDDVQDAIDYINANTQPTTVKEIWVAEGYYEPSVQSGTDPASMTFLLPLNTRLYGGFRGQDLPFTGENSINQRDGSRYISTILSGKIASTGASVRHVISCQPAPLTEIGSEWWIGVDGFRIEDARAAGPNPEDQVGAGIYAVRTSLLVKNCELENNVAQNRGGAIYWDSGQTIGDPTPWRSFGLGVSRSRLSSNTAVNSGGAIYARLPARIRGYNVADAPDDGVTSHIQNCEFHRNFAGFSSDPVNLPAQGGGAVTIYNHERMGVTGNIFRGNIVRGRGAALFMDYEHFDPSGSIRPVTLTLVNNTIYGNVNLQVPAGAIGDYTPAAVYSEPDPGGGFPLIGNNQASNEIVWGNQGTAQNGAMTVTTYYPASDWDVFSSDVQSEVTNWVWPNPIPGDPSSENINMDPQFENPAIGDLRLKNGSPCIDAGSDNGLANDAGDVNADGLVTPMDEVPYALDNDFGGGTFFKAPPLGVVRRQSTSPGAPMIDMGAHERGL